MNLKFYRMRKNAKLPVRAHVTDAGMDVFYCPPDESVGELYNRQKALSDGDDLWIPARETKVIPTGLKVQVPAGYMLEIKNKSGIASKRQLVVGACVVDPGYDGEVFINLHNLGTETQVIKTGEKLAQAVLVPVVHCGVEEVFEDSLNEKSDRGTGGFGSTGRW